MEESSDGMIWVGNLVAALGSGGGLLKGGVGSSWKVMAAVEDGSDSHSQPWTRVLAWRMCGAAAA